jgi:hypothetical protein
VKSPFHAAAIAMVVAAGAQYTIIDEQGHIVGSLVTDTPPGAHLRADPRADRTFRPDYAKALTVEQMSRAWQAEAERLAPQLVTGGG